MYTFKLRESLEFSEFGDEMIIYNKETGNAHLLNATAAEIIKLISEHHNLDDIVNILFSKYVYKEQFGVFNSISFSL